MLICAESEAEIHGRLGGDPWAAGRLVTVSVEPWLVLVGEERLPRLRARLGAAELAGEPG